MGERGVGNPPLALIDGSECPSLSQGKEGGESAAGDRPVLGRAQRASRLPVGAVLQVAKKIPSAACH